MVRVELKQKKNQGQYDIHATAVLLQLAGCALLRDVNYIAGSPTELNSLYRYDCMHSSTAVKRHVI